MEPCVETFVPSRLYARAGWLSAVLSALLASLAFRSPILLIAGAICSLVALSLLWLSARPCIQVGEMQFNIGDRAIAWREVTEVNRIRIIAPLVMRIKLTNGRKRLLIYPGEVKRAEQLLHRLRKSSYLATFDGVAYRDYVAWSGMPDLASTTAQGGPRPQPIRMMSRSDEDEIEKMFQKLKAVGSLDSRTDPTKSDEE